MRTAYHSQIDRQTEVLNQGLQQYSGLFGHENPSIWGKYLNWAEYHYNTSIHSATGLSTFQVVYGKPTPTISTYIPRTSNIEAVDTILTRRDNNLQLLKRNLMKAQKQMRMQAVRHRTDKAFEDGDWVISNSDIANNFQLNKLIKNFQEDITDFFRSPKKLA